MGSWFRLEEWVHVRGIWKMTVGGGRLADSNGDVLCPTPGVGLHQWGHNKQTWSIPGLLYALPECVPEAGGSPGERLWPLQLFCECARQRRHQ
uniref:Uncharacterized protein n=1 Tax=Cebus imitator TaxID=2715852 RepID=A0A2K5PJW7_CEBIM